MTGVESVPVIDTLPSAPSPTSAQQQSGTVSVLQASAPVQPLASSQSDVEENILIDVIADKKPSVTDTNLNLNLANEGIEDMAAAAAAAADKRSSVDSCVSLSYDAVPFVPRSGSISIAGGGSSGTDDETHNKTSSSGPENRTSSSDDADDAAFQPPDDELIRKIVDQVEFYFSDENIVKDAFLLKHVRRNKEGYVSLKLIASFKKVKHIARDWRMVRVALAKSTKLEVNEAGTKLRRRDPLPVYDQTTPSRTIVAFDIPPDKATIESVAEMFRDCGEIALVRILRPGNPIPADVRSFYNKHPRVQEGVSALIEFVRTESAHTALNREVDAACPVQVVELNAAASSAAKKRPPARKSAGRTVESEFSSSCPSGSETDDRYKMKMQQQQQQRRGSEKILGDQWSQRRWSRDSGTESSTSSYSRSRSNSGVFYIPDHQRRLSAGWDSSSDSYGSCRSRSNSGVSMPDVFHMRRYSVPRKEAGSSNCCCCEHSAGRRYSIARSSDDGYNAHPLSRCVSGENCSDGPYRRESVPDFYPLQRGPSFERRSSLNRSNDGLWSRSNSLSSSSDSPRRLSDADGRLALIRQRSFGNGIAGLPAAAETVMRLPRGPDGGRGFQREIIEYALPE